MKRFIAMKEIELKILDMSSTLQPADAYALVLKEVDGKRKLPIIIGSLEAQSIRTVLMGYTVPRPMTHDLMQTVMRELGATLQKVVIYKVNEGVFYSYIYIECAQKEYCVDSRTSDAIALALREPCPIYATEEVMSQEYMQEDAEGQFSVSVKLVSLPVLQQALDNAVRDENYELAAKLRDEIRKREKETKR
jgi:bifunctional DNase/RNase